MEELGSHQVEGINNPVRRKRSRTFRRPRPESQAASEIHDISSLSSAPLSDDAGKVSSDENTGGGSGSIRKEINVNQYASRFPQVNGGEDEMPSKRSKKEGVSLDVIYSNIDLKDGGGLNHKRSSEGVLAPANWKSVSRTKENLESQPRFISVNSRKSGEINSTSAGSLDGSGNENKLKKVKLKVGGTTRTIDANSNSSSKPYRSSDKLNGKDESDDGRPPRSDRRGGLLQGVPWKDFSSGGFILGKKDPSMGKGPSRSRPVKLADSARKSRRAPKKHEALDDDEDDDDEIKYLEKLKKSKLSSIYRDDEEESGKRHRKLSNFSGKSDDLNDAHVPLHSGKEGRRKSPSEDTDYEDEEEQLSDGEAGDKTRKKLKKEVVELVDEPKKEFALTTRQRALQSGKDASATGGSVIEFPNGLPPTSSRKQKEKLTDVELQLKKVEAAQRRKLQNEKAAKESEAEAIRKILGQDSSRKKREDKKKKRREELAQGKAADALLHASNTVRLTMGPNGTTVTFPSEMGLPSIFNSRPISYPPPREKCVGPSCTNPYKYRDSKTKLPLCSLQCYKAVQAPSSNLAV